MWLNRQIITFIINNIMLQLVNSVNGLRNSIHRLGEVLRRNNNCSEIVFTISFLNDLFKHIFIWICLDINDERRDLSWYKPAVIDQLIGKIDQSYLIKRTDRTINAVIQTYQHNQSNWLIDQSINPCDSDDSSPQEC